VADTRRLRSEVPFLNDADIEGDVRRLIQLHRESAAGGDR
jgi:hypothetical protein